MLNFSIYGPEAKEQKQKSLQLYAGVTIYLTRNVHGPHLGSEERSREGDQDRHMHQRPQRNVDLEATNKQWINGFDSSRQFWNQLFSSLSDNARQTGPHFHEIADFAAPPNQVQP